MSLRNQQSVYCPTCELHTEQERGAKRGERYCGRCGSIFTLNESRQAEAAANRIAAVDYKYDQNEAGRRSTRR